MNLFTGLSSGDKRFMFSGMHIYTSALVLFFALLLCQFPVSGQDNVGLIAGNPSQVVSRITIHIEGESENKNYYERMAKNVIFFETGDLFSEQLLQDSIDALKLTKQFQAIHVDSKENGTQIELIFHLTLARFIKAIRLKGNYPFFEKEILNLLEIYVGDMYDASVLVKQVKIIADFLKQKGFYAPGVYINAFQDKDDENYVVTIKIDKGPYYSLNHIKITGNRAFSDIRLKMRIKQFRYSFLPGMTNRFIAWDFKKEIDKLTTFYSQKGYPEVTISYDVDLDKVHNKANVHITVNEGEKYKISFEGNKAFGKRKLKKDIALFERRNNVRYGVRKTIRNIKTRYLNAGYQDARIRMEEDANPEENSRNLRFIIKEGPGIKVETINITGNKNISSRKIKKQISTKKPGPFRVIRKGRYVPDVLADDMVGVQTLYKNKGYLNAKIENDVTLDKTGTKARINIHINEGEKILVSLIDIKGLSAVPLKKAFQAMQLKENRPFRESLIIEDENTLSAMISEKGYPYVKVKGSYHITDNKAVIDYQVDEGIYVKMGHVYCSGNFHTKESTIKNEIAIAPDEPFSLVEILESQRNIQNMVIFSGTRFKSIGLKEKQDTINLFIEVEENKPYYVEFGSGYKSESGFFGKVEVGNHNLLGANKDAYILFEGSQIGQLEEVGILEPRFLGTHIEADLVLRAEKEEEYNKDYGTKTSSASLGFRRKLLKYTTAGITTKLRKTNQYPTTDTSDEESEEDVWTITPSIIYDTRDSFVRPKKGVLSSFSADISTDEFNIYEEDVDSLYDFVKYSADFRFYVTPYSPLTLAFRSMFGYIFPYNDDGWVKDEELFFLGGTNTVRGFRENMLEFDEDSGVGGMISALGSIEARIDMRLNFELTLFVDTGEIDNTDGEMKHPFNLDHLRTSAGLGLRYHTPIGPLGIFYGKNLDPRPGEDKGQWHFALGYTF